ncbi:MAG: hypothetical protein R2751_15985 [Bacteroidales bacterium]
MLGISKREGLYKFTQILVTFVWCTLPGFSSGPTTPAMLFKIIRDSFHLAGTTQVNLSISH